MTTYWVQYSYSAGVEASGFEGPPSTPLSFQGQELVSGGPVVTVLADPTPLQSLTSLLFREGEDNGVV